ncbi:carbohydrate ABC transporter permease [Tessaracoccus sp. OS52]|uniref:carbohydrate ABC transporter permease n=1 Tax=Tessaracoccus sp. OS52 TaxID=2886691 RepID=UPI001D11EE35|nr:carbohydrate ABC transporter permease [Tessaracoccus sp. OS52]MCC2593908.1 carbohydrate ABC transporter permease [Tessaracoccus sp. OS52]
MTDNVLVAKPATDPAADETGVAGTKKQGVDAAGAGNVRTRRRKDPSQQKRRVITRTALLVFLSIVSFIMAAPYLWMFLSAVRSPQEMAMSPMPLWPQEWHWENYVTAMNLAPFERYFFNSFLIAATHTVSNLLLGSMAGYALAKMPFRGNKLLFAYILGMQMVPFYAIIIPMFLLTRSMPLFGGNDIFGQGGIGWIDTYWALLIPALVSPFNIFLFRQFYVSTPTELQEAARIDGAGEWHIYARIMTPLIKPGLLTIALLSFEAGWNNFLWPLISTTSDHMRTIQLGLSFFRQEASNDFSLLMAGTTLASVPMIILFMVFQKQFVNGFVSSGLK